MTVTTNERGQMNMFAKEPYAERAERLNGRTAMIGFVSAIISYALTGKLFFGII
jgi:hypothetical protein